MSACISSHGEYSEHEAGADDPFTCTLCGAFDETAAVAANKARLNALGLIQQTIYTNSDNPPVTVWRNDEVLSMLEEIAELLIVVADTGRAE